jgi:hypothetical protein
VREVKTKTEDCGEELDGYWSVGYQGASANQEPMEAMGLVQVS